MRKVGRPKSPAGKPRDLPPDLPAGNCRKENEVMIRGDVRARLPDFTPKPRPADVAEPTEMAGVFVSDRLPFEPRWHGSPVSTCDAQKPSTYNVDPASFAHGTLPKTPAGRCCGADRPRLGQG